MNTRTHHTAGRRRPTTIAELGTVLGIWAHPDDEAYLSAGLMALARSAGQRVVVATATKGEVGTTDPLTWPPDLLARARERETADSLAALDVTEHHWLGDRDGTLHRLPPRPRVHRIARLIDEVRPDTIVTFGPDGFTGHRDHRTISSWVTAAWRNAGRPGRLWYVTATEEFHRAWGPVNEEIGLWYEGAEPPSDEPQDLAFQVRCDGDLLERKFAALSAHRTQTAGLIDRVGAQTYRRWWATESFVDAAVRPRAGLAA
jgi:LmbE family N-acetylglucosaminyl deacetylase